MGQANIDPHKAEEQTQGTPTKADDKAKETRANAGRVAQQSQEHRPQSKNAHLRRAGKKLSTMTKGRKMMA